MVRWGQRIASDDGSIPRAAPEGNGAESARMPRCRGAACRGAATAVCAILLVISACSSRRPKPAARPPVPVSVAIARRTAVPYTLTGNGLVTPMQLATVVPQVDGLITRVTFLEGDEVKQGRVLFQIEAHPYRAAYRQALATLARDRATAENAQRERQRYEALAAKEFVTKEQVDQTRATAEAARATVQGDEAAVASARFNLDKTTIRAPIGGRTGNLLVRRGNVVRAAQATPLVVINQIRPILVRFTAPGTDLPLIQRYAARGGLPVTAAPGAPPARSDSDTTARDDSVRAPTDVPDPATVQQLALAPPARGTLYFVDNAVDTSTGTIALKATFPNSSGTLWAGQFVLASLLLFVEQHALVVPSPAVRTGQRGTYVYLVDSIGKARQRSVVVERTTGDVAVIASGLADGDRVVTDGQSRLTPGAKVSIVGGPRGGGPRGGP